MFYSIRTRVFRGINALYRQQQQRGKKSLKGRGKQKKQGKPKIAKQTFVAKLTDETKENTDKPIIGQAYHDGSNWYLPAGTMVKHGTTTNNIRQILKYGILPSYIEGRSENRVKLPTTNDGVYVGSCYIAYASSWYNFAGNFQTLHNSKETNACRFDNIKGKIMNVMQSAGLECRFDNIKGKMMDVMQSVGLDEVYDLGKLSDILISKYVNKDKKDIRGCGLPIVLNIKLKEDVRIHADEDFVPIFLKELMASFAGPNKDLMASSFAGPSWNKQGSAAILQSIPADWIQTFECFEHNCHDELFALDKYVVTRSLQKNLTWNDSNKSRQFFSQFMTEGKKKRSLACQSFDFDLFHICMAAKIYQNKLMDGRQQWKNIVKRSNVFSKFRNKIDIESYLDELEGNNYLDMLGAAYNLNERFGEKGEELGLYVISKKV